MSTPPRHVAVTLALGSALLFACEATPSVDAGPPRDASATDGGSDATASDAARPDGAPRDATVPVEPCVGSACECSDGIDNDGDGLVDVALDLGCVAGDDATEGGLPTGTLERGWSTAEPSPDTRIVFVSAEGDDGWSGSLPEPDAARSDGPKRTLAAAAALLRDGSPDWLLVRRGDTFDETLGLSSSGRGADAPMIIATYGASTERPTVGGVFLRNVRHVFVLGLATRGELSADSAEDLLLEDCYVEDSVYPGIAFALGAHRDVRVRRNVANATRDSAFFFSGVTDLLIEENIIYRASTVAGGNHGMYITRIGNDGVVVRGNLVHLGKPSGNGIMQRPGGLAEGNVVVGVGWGSITLGACNDEGGPMFAPCLPSVRGTIRENLIAERRAMDFGAGVSFSSDYIEGGEVSRNMFVDAEPGAYDAVFGPPPSVVTADNVERVTPADAARPGLTFIGLYHETLGGTPTTDAFFLEAVRRSRLRDRAAYAAAPLIAFVRERVGAP